MSGLQNAALQGANVANVQGNGLQTAGLQNTTGLQGAGLASNSFSRKYVYFP